MAVMVERFPSSLIGIKIETACINFNVKITSKGLNDLLEGWRKIRIFMFKMLTPVYHTSTTFALRNE